MLAPKAAGDKNGIDEALRLLDVEITSEKGEKNNSRDFN